MALVLANRVQETTTTTGTGTVTLAGAVAGFQSFAIVGDANTTYYTITSGNNWEVGIGTYASSGTTLARTTVLSSSAAGAAITLAGTSTVFSSYPAEKAISDGYGLLPVPNGGTGAATLTGVVKGNGTSAFTAGTVALGSEVSGTLPVANGGTGVTASTGTGSVVLSSSPTLVTPTLGAASATSVAAALGAVGTPPYTFTGDLNTGMWSPAADTLAFSTNGAEVARLTSAGYLEAVYSDEVVALGNSGTATTINLNQGNVFTATLTGNCTFTLANPNANSNRGSSFTLILTNDATPSRSVAWAGGSFKFPGGASNLSRTTTANAVDIWVFFTPDNGTTYYGNISMKNMAA